MPACSMDSKSNRECGRSGRQTTEAKSDPGSAVFPLKAAVGTRSGIPTEKTRLQSVREVSFRLKRPIILFRFTVTYPTVLALLIQYAAREESERHRSVRDWRSHGQHDGEEPVK